QHHLPDAPGDRVGEVRVEEMGAHRLVVDHLLGVDGGIRVVLVPGPPGGHLLAHSLEFRRGDQRLGELVADQRVGAGGLAGTGQRDHHRGRPDAGGDVPGVVRGARHYERSAITKSEKMSTSSTIGLLLIHRPSLRISSRERRSSARQPCPFSQSATSARWPSKYISSPASGFCCRPISSANWFTRSWMSARRSWARGGAVSAAIRLPAALSSPI